MKIIICKNVFVHFAYHNAIMFSLELYIFHQIIYFDWLKGMTAREKEYAEMKDAEEDFM